MITRESVARSGWPVRPLADLVEFLDNRRKPVTEKDRVAGPYIYYGANGPQGTIDQFIFDEPLILVAEDGGNFGQEGRTIAYQVEGKCWVNNHAHVLRPKPGVDIRFLCRHLEHYDVTPFVNGTTRGKLTKGNTEQIPIALPPLAEQKRIAAVLDKADDLRSKRRQALATLDTLLQSVFLDMFGDPVTNPKGWSVVTVASLLAEGDSRIRTGPFGSQLLHSEFVSEGVPVLGIENVVTNEFRWTEPRCIAEGKYRKNFTRYRVFPDDVLVTIMGTVGRVCVAPDNLPECMSTKHLCVITLDKTKVLPAFIWASFLHDTSVRSQMRMAGKGAIMEGWNSTTIRQLRVMMPPLKLQREFVQACDAIRATNRVLVRHGAAADALFTSLQSAAFSGTLFNGEMAKAAASKPARPTVHSPTSAQVAAT